MGKEALIKRSIKVGDYEVSPRMPKGGFVCVEGTKDTGMDLFSIWMAWEMKNHFAKKVLFGYKLGLLGENQG